MAPAMSKHVFLVYNSSRKAIAVQLANAIREKTHTCFVSCDIMPGSANLVAHSEEVSRAHMTIILGCVCLEDEQSDCVKMALTAGLQLEADKRRVIVLDLGDKCVHASCRVDVYRMEFNPRSSQHIGNLIDHIENPPPAEPDDHFVNLGYSLAWSYFHGLLAIQLPKLEQRLNGYGLLHSNGEVFQKLVVVSYNNAKVVRDFHKQPSPFEKVTDDDVTKFNAYRAGKPSREYRDYVFAVKRNDKKYQTAIAIVDVTEIMADGDRSIGISPEDREKEMKSFQTELRNIVRKDRACKDKMILVTHTEGTGEKDLEILADEIISAIENDREEELGRELEEVMIS